MNFLLLKKSPEPDAQASRQHFVILGGEQRFNALQYFTNLFHVAGLYHEQVGGEAVEGFQYLNRELVLGQFEIIEREFKKTPQF